MHACMRGRIRACIRKARTHSHTLGAQAEKRRIEEAAKVKPVRITFDD